MKQYKYESGTRLVFRTDDDRLSRYNDEIVTVRGPITQEGGRGLEPMYTVQLGVELDRQFDSFPVYEHELYPLPTEGTKRFNVYVFEEVVSIFRFTVEAPNEVEARQLVLDKYENDGGSYEGSQEEYEVQDSGISHVEEI